MSKNYIESYSSEQLKALQVSGKTHTNWERLQHMTDADIDTSDIPELDEDFWKNAELVMPKITLEGDKVPEDLTP